MRVLSSIKITTCRAAALLIVLAAQSIVRAQDSSAPAILQWFEASYTTIEKRTPDLFLAGYGAAYLPPPGRADSGNQSVGYDVYDRFDLGRGGNPTLYGTERGLKATVMVNRVPASVAMSSMLRSIRIIPSSPTWIWRRMGSNSVTRHSLSPLNG